MLFLILLLLSPVSSSSSSSEGSDPRTPVSVSSDAASLLTLKSQNDPTNSLHFTLTEHLDYCHWPGIKCESSQVIRLFLPNSSLRNPILPDSIPRLSQLRVLVLRNNSLSGTLPDLSPLHNLRSLILSFNSFSGPFPPSILSLYKLRVLDLSFNSFSGTLPYNLCLLDRLVSLKLQFNKFNAALPNINQTNLQVFNVSANNFSGEIVSTTVLSRFPQSSFSLNPFLCGALLHKPCANRSTFLDSSSASDATNHPSLVTPPSSTQPPQHQNQNQKKKLIILVFTFAGMLLFSSLICLFLTTKSKMRHNTTTTTTTASSSAGDSRDAVEKTYFTTASTAEAIIETQDTNNNNNNIKINQYKEKSGNLVFCVGEAKQYTLEQLFRASAEMLGRGTVGTTYKAKLDNQLIVTVKRLDAMKMSGVNGEVFEHHMGVVGGLRHPNLVPVRAFFQARQERLIIFDYQPNGSVFSLIHGSRSTRAKPLHWTSCLKIAEDVAQGLAYIHQASKLIHGNLKASNVLLGVDFEACITDYCLATLAESSEHEDPDSARYRGPEARQSGRRATHKSDVYAFGVLLLELLSGKRPSQHPFLASPDMPDWVKAVRGVDDGSEENQLGMLVEVASICSLTSPEQRPTMWQVLKMIQRIKDSVGPDDGIDTSTG